MECPESQAVQLCTLTDLETGKKTSSESVIRLPRHSYQAFSVSIPQVENGHYLFTWDLFSNKRSPVLQKRMTREVTVEYIPLHVTLLRPAYRNNLYATMPDKTIEAQIELREDIGIPLTVELTGENVREVRKIARSGGRDRVLFDGAKLADGRYTLKVRCKKNGRELAASVKIRKLPYRKGEVWLDARGVTHVDGVPFLPYGCDALACGHFQVSVDLCFQVFGFLVCIFHDFRCLGLGLGNDGFSLRLGLIENGFAFLFSF